MSDKYDYYTELRKSLDPETQANKLKVPQFTSSSLYTVTDFREDPKVVEAFERVTDYLATTNIGFDAATNPEEDDDPVEFLRDDFTRVETAVSKAMAFKDAPESVKQDYQFLRSQFENAEVTGFGEGLNAFLDYGNDAIFNYGNAATLGLAAITGAASFGGGTVATVGARAGASRAASAAMNQVLKIANPTKVGYFAGQGAVVGGAASAGEQKLQIAIGERETYSPSEIAISSAVGAGIGAGLGAGMAGIGSTINKFRTRRQIEDADIDVELGDSTGPQQLQLELNQKSQEAVPLTPDEVSQEIDAEEEFRLGMLELLNGTINDLEIVAGSPEEQFKAGLNELLGGVSSDLTDLVGGLATKVSAAGDELRPESFADWVEIEELVERIGGGQQTYNVIVDAALAAARKETPAQAQSNFLNTLHKYTSRFTSNVSFGKAAGFLAPYTKSSPTAKLLMEKINTEFGLTTTPGQKLIEEDYAGSARNFTGRFYEMFTEAVLPISTKKFNTRLSETVNNALSLALRGQASQGEEYSGAVNVAAGQIRKAYRVAGRLLEREGFIKMVPDYVPRQWKRSAIEQNRPEFERLLVQVGEAKDARQAKSIVTNMLELKNQLGGGSKNYFFSANRKFENITDDALFEKFLNNDVKSTFYNYMDVAGRALAKKKVFGIRDFGLNNKKGFKTKWIEQISKEVEAATGQGLSRAEKLRIQNLYQTITSERIDENDIRIKSWGHQGYELATRFAQLPFATISSLTEIFLNLGVAGGVKTAKGIAAAHKIGLGKLTDDWNALAETMNASFLKITKDSHQQLQDKFGLTPAEAWKEMQSVGLLMEQELASMADRLAGEELTTEWMQKASNKFFRGIMLDQWTKMVQNVSFQTGKVMIRDHLEDIVNHGTAPITRRMQAKLDDLAELGIDVGKGKQWLEQGGDKNSDFYRDVVEGAARYANQIILQPDRASGLKPRFQYTPTGSVLFNLMGYPTAFTNNILKRGGKRLLRDKDIAAQKLVPAALVMTAAAGFTNYARNRGEGYDDKSAEQVMYEAVARWGGNGLPLDNVMRIRDNVEYDGLIGIPASFLGPIYGEVVDVAGYKKPISALGKKVPFYGAGKTVLGEEAMTEYRRTLSEADKAAVEAILGEKSRTAFKKGGEVDVPQAPEEPDERIDKMTGRPYNEQAGTAFQDEEDFPRSLLARNV